MVLMFHRGVVLRVETKDDKLYDEILEPFDSKVSKHYTTDRSTNILLMSRKVSFGASYTILHACRLKIICRSAHIT